MSGIPNIYLTFAKFLTKYFNMASDLHNFVVNDIEWVNQFIARVPKKGNLVEVVDTNQMPQNVRVYTVCKKNNNRNFQLKQ